jgi:hypothetical protein
MAHFAELNSSNEVLRVIVVSNEDVNANGGDYSTEAETFVSGLLPHLTGGVAWKQTSYNGNARKQYAAIGHTYNPSKDKFLSPRPFDSWTLDSNDDWEAPVAFPSNLEVNSNPVSEIQWDEDNQKWLGKTVVGEDAESAVTTNYEWNPSSSTWAEV